MHSSLRYFHPLAISLQPLSAFVTEPTAMSPSVAPRPAQKRPVRTYRLEPRIAFACLALSAVCAILAMPSAVLAQPASDFTPGAAAVPPTAAAAAAAVRESISARLDNPAIGAQPKAAPKPAVVAAPTAPAAESVAEPGIPAPAALPKPAPVATAAVPKPAAAVLRPATAAAIPRPATTMADEEEEEASPTIGTARPAMRPATPVRTAMPKANTTDAEGTEVSALVHSHYNSAWVNRL